MKTLSPSLSRREKLLLGLLTSTLIFSASFSYGAVNSNKVDAIMKMITDGGTKFSDIPVSGQNKSERTQYYEKVDAGLGDAVEMLATVRNNIRSLMGLSPAYTADDIVGSILGGVMNGVGGTSGGNVATSGTTGVDKAGNSSENSSTNITYTTWSYASPISCPKSLAELQTINPSTYSNKNSSGYKYSTSSDDGVFFNTKDYPFQGNTFLPPSCEQGQKWVSRAGKNMCIIYNCNTYTASVGVNNKPLLYQSVYGFDFGIAQGKLQSGDQSGQMTFSSGAAGPLAPWEVKLRALYPRCTEAQKAGDACVTENSMCWADSLTNKQAITSRAIYLACKKNPTIRNSCPTTPYTMANDTSRGGTDADRIQMTWDEGDWRTLRYGSGTKTWKFDPSTRVFAKRDGQGKYPGRLDQTDYRFVFFLEDAWTNEAYVLQDTISISECPGDFSQETIDRGCVIGNDIAYSDGTRVDPAFIHRSFWLSLIASETLPPSGPRCTIDPYKTYYVNIKSSLPGQREVIGAHFGGPNIFDSATYFTTSLWSYNKARAPYARKPCSGWHCERTDPHRDWYGHAEVGASDDFVGPVSGK